MRKTFLKVSLFSLLTVGMAASFTACKDYDDDINKTNQSVADLSLKLDTQVKALEDKIASCNADIAAAKKAADDAAKAAQAAQAAGDAAGQAAAEAKADAARAAEAAAEAKKAASEALAAAVKDLQEKIDKNAINLDNLTEQHAKDIAAINGRLNGLDESINKINKAIEDLNVDNLVAQINNIKEQLKALEDISKIQETLKTQGKAIENFEKFQQEQGKLNAATADSLKNLRSDITTMLGTLDDLQGQINDQAEQVSYAVETINSQIIPWLQQLSNRVEDIDAALITLQNEVLRSLVFVPELYVDGIESVEYGFVDYNAKNGTMPGTSVPQDHNGQPAKILGAGNGQVDYLYTSAVTPSYINPIEWISYHKNPASAVVAKDQVSLISRNAEAIQSRATKANPYIAKDAVKSENGILSVGLVCNGIEAYNDKEGAEGTTTTSSNYGKVTLFALQAEVPYDEKNDTLITSDYARIYATKIIPQAVAFSGVDPQAVNCPTPALPDHLYSTAVDAVKNAPSLAVQWDKTLDLKELFAAHYAWYTKTSNAAACKTFTAAQLEKYGLTFDYALVQYTVGTNVTSDSKYATITDGVLAPCDVTNAGQPTGNFNQASVGRRPLIRVRVMDDNKVVLVGFVRVEIKKQVTPTTTKEFDLGKIYFQCNDVDSFLTWSEVSAEVLSIVGDQGMSKNDFDLLYALDTDANGVAYQYTDDKGTRATVDYGVITEKVNITGATTTVLNWNFDLIEQQKVYELPNHKVTVYVRYLHRTAGGGASTQHAPIYLPMTIEVVKPIATVNAKLDDYWFESKSKVYGNVPQPYDGGTPTPFRFDLNSAWGVYPGSGVTLPPSVTSTNRPYIVTGAQDLPFTLFNIATNDFLVQNNANGAGYKFYFTAENNNKVVTWTEVSTGRTYSYTLWVDAITNPCLIGGAKSNKNMGDCALMSQYINTLDLNEKAPIEYGNAKIYATVTGAAVSTRQEIAALDQNSGVVTYNQNSEYAKILLNAFNSLKTNEGSNDRLDANLMFEIGMCFYTDCNVAMKLTNGEYPVRLLRPLNIRGTQGDHFVEAAANYSYVDLFNLFGTIDWRGADLNTLKNVWLYAFYGVNKVTIDLPNVTTNMIKGGVAGVLGQTLLTDQSQDIKLAQVDDDKNVVTGGLTINLSAYNSADHNTQADYNAIKAAFGKIRYQNNGIGVQQKYTLRFPVTFSYIWGDINTYLDVEVYPTEG